MTVRSPLKYATGFMTTAALNRGLPTHLLRLKLGRGRLRRKCIKIAVMARVARNDIRMGTAKIALNHCVKVLRRRRDSPHLIDKDVSGLFSRKIPEDLKHDEPFRGC